MQFEILLQEPDGGEFLPGGLPPEAHALAENTEAPGTKSDTLAYADHANAIDQGWAVFYPEGRSDLLEAISSLIALRQRQIAEKRASRHRRGPPPPIQKWALLPNATFDAFHRGVYEQLPEPLQPRYLLILGDLSEISVEFQQGLMASGLFVGRLCFMDDNGQHDLSAYAAYAAKVVKSEAATVTEDPPRLLFYATRSERMHSRPDALDNGYSDFISPSFSAALNPIQELVLDRTKTALMGPRQGAGSDSWADLLAAARSPQPSILLSLSHGAGRAGWSLEEQRAFQGRMKLSDATMLDLADVGDRPFLPNGMWFYYACFGGGTPSESGQVAWMRKLVAARYWLNGVDVLGTLSKSKGGFVAKQPQVALANPDGPLAVFAHVDLAFVAAFKDYAKQHPDLPKADGEPAPGGQRALRVLGVLKTLTEGKRAGLALEALTNAARRFDQVLLDRYKQDANLEAAVLAQIADRVSFDPNPESDAQLAAILAAYVEERSRVGSDRRMTMEALAEAAHMPPHRILSAFVLEQAEIQQMEQARLSRSLNWMAREDLRGFILLGDPAVRLPIIEQP